MVMIEGNGNLHFYDGNLRREARWASTKRYADCSALLLKHKRTNSFGKLYSLFFHKKEAKKFKKINAEDKMATVRRVGTTRLGEGIIVIPDLTS